MLQHRHVWSDGTFSAWHNPERVHTGEKDGVPYANDTIFQTREAKVKAKAPEFSYDEYGELVTPPPPPTEGELFALEAALAEAEVKAALAKAPARTK